MYASASSRVFRLAAILDLSLVLIQSALPAAHDWLPLCGGHLQQLGLCFGLAFIVMEIHDLLQPADKAP